jgi:hypothetical protein
MTMGRLKSGKAIQDEISLDNLARLRLLIQKSRWIFAKTMPELLWSEKERQPPKQYPHWIL